MPSAPRPSAPQLTNLNRAMLQYTTDYFDQYWLGLSALQQFLADNASGARAAIRKSLQVPRQRMYPRHADNPPDGPPLDITKYRGVYSANKAERHDHFIDSINQGLYGVIEYARPLELELKKVLGKGAFGIACLFELSDLEGIRRNIVIKASINANDVSREVAHLNVSQTGLAFSIQSLWLTKGLIMKRLAGADHIVQRIYFRDLPGAQLGSLQDGDAGAPASADTGTGLDISGQEVQQEHSLADIAKSFDEQANMFAMEYMRNGDVRSPTALSCPTSAMYQTH